MHQRPTVCYTNKPYEESFDSRDPPKLSNIKAKHALNRGCFDGQDVVGLRDTAKLLRYIMGRLRSVAHIVWSAGCLHNL